MSEKYPILEFDPDRSAVLEPKADRAVKSYHKCCVLTFFHSVIEKLKEEGHLRQIDSRPCETGPVPIYELEWNGQLLNVALCGIGAPFAAAFLDELAAFGVMSIIACGGAGVLDSSHEMGQLFVPTSAVRDEGTSYHYLPPGRESKPCPKAVSAITRVLDRHDIPYISGKTWTTDAVYRETRGRIARRKAEGCLTVEMEAAAFFAAGEFRGVSVGEILYGGDDVGGETWDDRGWTRASSVRERLFWLAVEACMEI